VKLTSEKTLYIAGAIALLGIASTTYLLFKNNDQQEQIASLLQDRNTLLQESNQRGADLAIANTTIDELTDELTVIKEELEELADDYRDEKDRNEEFEDQIRDLAGTLGDLDKLAKIDEELLAKYSKAYFLNENYIPSKLKQIDEKYVHPIKTDEYFHGDAIDYLEDLMKAAHRADLDLLIVSAYRSFDEQNQMKSQYKQVYGEGANTFSADQGFSEHQLGTTVDFTTTAIGGAYDSFSTTEEYQWLLDNAHKYGFILSYPEDNEFYIFEPWHWRFVGTDLARHLDRSDDTFYTMEQREIDEYLLEFFD
jgi:D-alanyl-D-alanine carboxypeptidase